MKIALATLLALTPVSVLADEYQAGYSTSRNCFKTEYREEYIPGNADSPGYVQSFHETIEVPCKHNEESLRRGGYTRKTTIEFDNNDCSEGSVIGGLLGAGIALSSSRGKDRFWAVPAGGTAGALIGCQVDGG